MTERRREPCRRSAGYFGSRFAYPLSACRATPSEANPCGGWAMSEPFTVAIVGAGFSGVMTAVHLLRGASPRPLRVLMVNRSGAMARGVAYGTNSPAHLL